MCSRRVQAQSFVPFSPTTTTTCARYFCSPFIVFSSCPYSWKTIHFSNFKLPVPSIAAQLIARLSPFPIVPSTHFLFVQCTPPSLIQHPGATLILLFPHLSSSEIQNQFAQFAFIAASTIAASLCGHSKHRFHQNSNDLSTLNFSNDVRSFLRSGKEACTLIYSVPKAIVVAVSVRHESRETKLFRLPVLP